MGYDEFASSMYGRRRRTDLRGERYYASYNNRLPKFLAENATKLESGQEIHLHALWDQQSGKVVWRGVTKGNSVCHDEGRCIKAVIK